MADAPHPLPITLITWLTPLTALPSPFNMADAPHSHPPSNIADAPYPPAITLNMAGTPHITLNMADAPHITLNMADAPALPPITLTMPFAHQPLHLT